MAHSRRLQTLLACLLAFLMVGGAALPSPLLWQCRHATRLMPATFAANSAAMPCRMGGGTMSATMACCRTPKPRNVPGHSPLPKLGRPGCHPILTLMAVPSAARIGGDGVRMARQLAAMVTPGLPPPSALFPVRLTVPQRQRPPPLTDSFRPIPLSNPCLRAPPSA